MNTLGASRVMRRAMLPVAIACALFFWWRYGTLRVPAGMDTMGRGYPPGTLCLIDAHPAALVPGQVVFLDVEGRTVLSRVREVQTEWLTVAHDDRASRWGDGSELGRLPHTAVTGVVLTAFVSRAPRDASGSRPR